MLLQRGHIPVINVLLIHATAISEVRATIRITTTMLSGIIPLTTRLHVAAVIVRSAAVRSAADVLVAVHSAAEAAEVALAAVRSADADEANNKKSEKS